MKFSIINKLKDGYIIMSPNGDTGYITELEYQILKLKERI